MIGTQVLHLGHHLWAISPTREYLNMVDDQQEAFIIEDDEAQATPPEQAEVTETEEVEAQGVTPEEESGAQPDEEVSEEQKVTFTEEQQEIFNREISKKVAKQREIERQLEAIREENARIRQQLPQQQGPEVPPMPNPDDYYGRQAEYESKVKERDAAIAKRAEYDAQRRNQQVALERQAYQQEMARQAEARKVQEGYVEKATKLGFEPQKIAEQSATVAQFIRNPDIQDHVAMDEHGPLIVAHLANNVVEAEKIGMMTPIRAALYIETHVKPNLASTRKKTTAPKPPSIVQGGGAPETKDERLSGVTFE